MIRHPAHRNLLGSVEDDDARIEGGAPLPANPNAPLQGWPAAGAHSSDHWDHSTTPSEYQIRSGDTISGLAARYLGNPARYMEIWSIQTGSGASPSREYVKRYYHALDPSSPGVPVRPGMFLVMPAEAAARAKQMDAAGASVPGAGGSPGTLPGGFGQAGPNKTGQGMSTGAKIAIGAGIVGLGAFLLSE